MSIQTSYKSSDVDTDSSRDRAKEKKGKGAPEDVMFSEADSENVAPVRQAECMWVDP